MASVPLVAQQQTAADEQDADGRVIIAQGTRNNADRDLAVAGGLSILADDLPLVMPTIADLPLYNRALLFRAIGNPLLITGVILTSLSAITWLTWAVSIFGTPILASFIGTGNAITRQFIAITAPLFAVSMALTTVGGSLLVSGGVLNSLGNDYRTQSFTSFP